MKFDHVSPPQGAESLRRNSKTYCCPGETASISEAVHWGRLAAGWSGCAECVWRHDQGSGSGQSSHVSRSTNSVQVAPPRIRRTEFGVRGPYLNAIDRFRGAQLASIFSMHLAAVHHESLRLRNSANVGQAVEKSIAASPPITVVVGYDGRPGSADIFSGVVSAVQQNGCNVVDAGRSTAASILNVSRRYPHLCGSLLVTGAGEKTGSVGLDVFDPHGQGVAVPWQKFGVSVRIQPRADANVPLQPASEADFGSHAADVVGAVDSVGARLRDLRSFGRKPESKMEFRAEQDTTFLKLPELHNSAGAVFRANRRSGTLTAIPAEQFYHDWLLRWWPVHSRQAAVCLVNDDQTAQRLEWLMQHCSLNIEVQRPRNSLAKGSAERRMGAGEAVSFELQEDDRFLIVRSRRGREIPIEELAAWMNRCMPTTSTHLTAHASPCGRRVLLVDVAAPDTGHQQQVISDGLALAGWILTSLADGQNPLPV